MKISQQKVKVEDEFEITKHDRSYSKLLTQHIKWKLNINQQEINELELTEATIGG